MYKELERLLKEKKADISPEKAIDIAKTIYQITATDNGITIKYNLILTDEQKHLAQLFQFR
jgi:hypothetical protein